MTDWPDELEGDATAFTSTMRQRLIAVHASMDEWAVDFLAALHRLDDGKSLDKP